MIFVTKRFKGLQELVLTLSSKIVKLEREVEKLKHDVVHAISESEDKK